MNFESVRRFGWVIPFAILILALIEILLRGFGIVPDLTPKIEPVVYRVEELPDEWELLWMTTSTELKVPENPGSISLVSSSDDIFALEQDAIVKIDLVTGEASRCVRIDKPTFGGSRTTTLLANSTQLFLGFNGTQKIRGSTEWGAARIEAYHVDSCTQIWSREIGGARSFDVLMATETSVSVDGNSSSDYYLLDGPTGTIRETLSKRDSPFIWKIDEAKGVVYIRTVDASFVAKDLRTDEILWTGPINNAGIYQPPLFTDTVIIARLGAANEDGKVFAVDISDGSILWEMENVIGNVAVGGDRVFLFTKDTRLLALDLMTGDITSVINFAPDDMDYSVSNAFQIAVESNMMIIYTGESHQLFGFRFLPEQNLTS